MKRNKNGFSVVELLIVIVITALLGIVAWTVYGRSAHKNSSGGQKPAALLYAQFDSRSMKINSYNLDSRKQTQLLEQAVPEADTSSRSFVVLDAQVSTDRQLVAYRFNGKGKVKIMKSDGTNLRDVPRSNINSFAWLSGKRQLILEVSNYVNCTGVNCEAPINGFASDWYVYDVDSNKETKLYTTGNAFNSLAGQRENTLYFASNSPYGGISPKLHAYNLKNDQIAEVYLPNEEGIQIGFIASSPDGKHTIVSILPSYHGVNYKCTIYELRGDTLGKKLVDDANYQCDDAYWINDDTFYFDKSTGPNGEISTSNNSPSGYYILLSVYSYSLSDNQQKKLLVSDGSEVYRLLGSLPDGSFIVSNESSKRNPQYKLEIRNPDGSLKRSVADSTKEMLFIGSIK